MARRWRKLQVDSVQCFERTFVPFAGDNDKKFSKFGNSYHSGTRQIKSDHQISIFLWFVIGFLKQKQEKKDGHYSERKS